VRPRAVAYTNNNRSKSTMNKCECCGTRHDPMKTDCPDDEWDCEEFDYVEFAEDAGGRPLNR